MAAPHDWLLPLAGLLFGCAVLIWIVLAILRSGGGPDAEL